MKTHAIHNLCMNERSLSPHYPRARPRKGREGKGREKELTYLNLPSQETLRARVAYGVGRISDNQPVPANT